MTGSPNAGWLFWRPFGFWLLAFALLCAPLILTREHSNLSDDEAEYYLPAIARIRSHWPRLELVGDSLSATSPGYPYALATVSFLTGPSRLALRIVNWTVSAGVLALLWSVLQRRGAGLTLALAPLALSNFFVKSASWLVTDNAALLLTAAALFALFFNPGASALRRGSLAAALAVAVRQTNAWLVLPLALREALDAWRQRTWPRWGWLVAPLIPLGILVAAWHGLVPPVWKQTLAGGAAVSLTPLVYGLAVLATLGLPFYLSVTGPSDWRDALSRRGVWMAALVGLALAVIAPTAPDHEAGRWGGYWWSLAARVPTIGHASPIFLVLAPAGAVTVGALWHRLRLTAGAPSAALWAAALTAWSATTLVNPLVFHRYFEAPLLVFLIAWTALQATAREPARLTRRWPLMALAAGQFALTLITAHGQAYGLVHPK